MTLQRPTRRKRSVLALSSPPILPVYGPSQPHSLPDLPSRARQPAFDTTRSPFTLTTHLVPAAHPRTYPDYPLPGLPSADSSKAEKKDLTIKNTRTLLEYQDSQHLTPGIGSRRPLWVCLNRYVRENLRASGSGPRITLLLAHANGFPKEVRRFQAYMRLSWRRWRLRSGMCDRYGNPYWTICLDYHLVLISMKSGAGNLSNMAMLRS
jgi:hypothetical protein